MNFTLEKINSLLIIFFPILIISGPLLPELSLIFIIFSFLIITNNEEKTISKEVLQRIQNLCETD